VRLDDFFPRRLDRELGKKIAIPTFRFWQLSRFHSYYVNSIIQDRENLIMKQLEQYLKPTYAIDSDSPSIIEKAAEITSGQEDITANAQSLFYYVRDQIKYNMFVPISLLEHNRASNILQNGEGYCVQKAVLLTALARASGIPARLGFADFRNHLLPQKYVEIQGSNLILYHGFSEFHLNGKWIKLTPAFDIKMCTEYHIIPVDFDGEHDAIFHPFDRDGKKHIEYVKFHGSFQDLPFDDITNYRFKEYGMSPNEMQAQVTPASVEEDS